MTMSDAWIYVLDDDSSVREAIVGAVRAAGFNVVGFKSALEFLSFQRPAGGGCLVLDVEMPELNGLDLQRRLNAANDTLPIIFVTGHADVPMSVTAIKAGAVDFLTKPFDADTLVEALRRALVQQDQRPAATAGARVSGGEQPTVMDEIIGSSLALRNVLQQVKTVAPTDTTVLIQGETGTGKERIARALHDLSDRKGGRFVKVNCAAIPSALLESELMGHERGAFTGAVAQRIGRFELAHGGTIFLDEIGELPLDLQPKLLRILQEREFERLGSTRTVRSNARVIAATNRDLAAMVAERSFREDLYYRLSVFPVELPPLRHRMEDVPLLARRFVQQLASRMGKQIDEIPSEVLERLARHRWPGNIRELQNVLERAVILAKNGNIQVPEFAEEPCFEDSHPEVESDVRAATAPRSEGLAEVSRAHILRVLNETNWVVAGPRGAAARLEMKRSTLNF
jgi:DNA-binding NtrC family response regulator